MGASEHVFGVPCGGFCAHAGAANAITAISNNSARMVWASPPRSSMAETVPPGGERMASHFGEARIAERAERR